MNRIKCIRIYNGLSQIAFGKIFSVDQTAVSNWENGKNNIDVKTVEKISNHFSLPMDFIYGLPFKVSYPIEQWHTSLIEDYNNAPEVVKDLILFKHGKGYFHETYQETNEKTYQKEKPADETELTAHEISVLNAYRNQPEMQPAIDKLLGIYNGEYVKLYTAASSKDNRPDEFINMPKEKWEKIKNTPDTDDSLM